MTVCVTTTCTGRPTAGVCGQSEHTHQQVDVKTLAHPCLSPGLHPSQCFIKITSEEENPLNRYHSTDEVICKRVYKRLSTD